MAYDLVNDPFAQRPGPAFPAYKPEEEDSVLSKLGGIGLSGLGWVGQTLAKPGRAVRGLLAGKPEELLNLLPFSDTLGITDPNQSVSGRDLLYHAGLTGAPQKGFEWEDIPGFGLDVLTDPLTYVNPLSPLVGGGLTKTGAADKLAGKLAPRLSERIAQGQAGLFHSALGPIGTGPTAQKTADLLGQLYDKAAYSKPGLALGGMFSAARNVFGRPATTEATARLAEDIYQATPKAVREATQPYYEEMRKLAEAGQLKGTGADLRGTVEKTFAGPLQPESQQAADFLKRKREEQFLTTRDAGNPLEYLPDSLHRQTTPTEAAKLNAGRGHTPYPTLGAENIGREEMFKIFKGTDPLNAILRDPLAGSGVGPKNNLLNEAKYIRSKVPQYNEVEHGQLQKMLGTFDPQGNPMLEPTLKDWLQRQVSGGTATAQEAAHLDRINRFNELTNIHKQSEHLADFATTLDPKYAQEHLPYFGNNVFVDQIKAAESTAKKAVTADKVTDVLSKIGTNVSLPGPFNVPGQAAAHPGRDMVRVTDTLKELGMTDKATEILARKMGLQPGDIHNVYIPKQEHEAFTRLMTGFNEPEATKGLMGVVNTMSNAFKAGVTTWPAKYIRDFTQQVWSMFVGGHHDPSYSAWNPMGYIKPMRDAENLFVKGEAIDGLSKAPYFASRGLSDAEASKELQAAAMAAKMAGPEKLVRDVDVAGQSQHALQANIQAPGEKQPPLLPFGPDKSLLGMAVPRSKAEANPLNIRGIGSKTETQFAPKKAGDAIQGRIDDWTRGGSLVALLRQGFDLDEAIQQVKKVHYDYGALAPFEQKVMKSLVPFWSWTRSNLPAQLRLLAENPGGVTSRAIQQSERLRQKEGFLPESLQDTFALPLGGEENGTQRFLSRTGLPFEDVFSALPVGHGSVSKNVAHSLMELGSSMNPLIKGPAEFATGKQLSTGRDLEHLEPRSGRILSEAGLLNNPRDVPPLLENVLMNSPLSRLLTTVGTGMDPRKGMSGLAANLASPLRVTDVDMNRQREIEGRRMLEELLSQNPNVKQFQDFYVPKEMRGNLSQEDVALMRLQATFAKNARDAKKKLGAAK